MSNAMVHDRRARRPVIRPRRKEPFAIRSELRGNPSSDVAGVDRSGTRNNGTTTTRSEGG